MQFKALARCSQLHEFGPKLLFQEHRPVSSFAPRIRFRRPWSALSLKNPSKIRGNGFVRPCFVSGKELVESEEVEIGGEEDCESGVALLVEAVAEPEQEELGNQSIWDQMKEIAMFTGPATGLWICGPLMSLIDTAVIDQGSSIELAALGPGTVICDYMSYLFMFLSIATSNLDATSLASVDKKEVQHQISILLFVGLACGFFTLFFTKSFGSQALIAFAGPNNAHLVPAANKYVQIRAIAWPAVLVGCVAQSASLGMKDSWAPLKALGAGTVINGIGDVVLCIYLSCGIAGAAWATMVSQVVAAYIMIEALNKKGYNALAISIPSLSDVSTIVGVAGPLSVGSMSKVAFYVVMIYFAASMGINTGCSSDYNMLKDVNRISDATRRTRAKLGTYTGPQYWLLFHLKGLRNAAANRKTKLLFLPSGMSKREKNKSCYDHKKKLIQWTIEWRFHSTDVILLDHGVHKDRNLLSIVENHLQPSPWSNKLR